MIIGVYGISRVGKDYFISQLISNINKSAKHIEGSKNLNSKFVKKQEESTDIIFVDGHYSFPVNDNEFQKVITKEDVDLYDIFIYLDRSSDVIHQNAS